MPRKKSAFNYDRQLFGFNITETGIKSWTKTFKLGPFSQTINVNLQNGHMKGTTSLPGTGLAKRYDLPTLDDFRTPDLPEYKRKPDMWTDDE